LAIADLFEDLQDRLRPLRGRLFPRQVLFELHDDHLRGQVLREGRAAPVSIDVPLPALTCRDGMPLEKEPLGDLIGDLLVRDGLLDAFVLAALPAAAVESRVVVWPFQEMPDDPIDALRQLDPPLELSSPLDDLFVDLTPLPGTPAQMLLGASPRRLVEAWIEVFNLAGAQLERLAPAQSCQLVALQPLLRLAPPGQLLALLDPQGPDQDCRLLLLRGGLPVFERVLAGRGEELVEEVQRCVSFYRRQDSGVRTVRVLLTSSLEEQAALERSMGVEAEILASEPFGSLVLEGLATPEVLL
jgi:hypothetical protein